MVCWTKEFASNFTLTGLWLTPCYTGGSQDGVGGGGWGGGEREGGGANVTQPPAEWLRITMGNGVSHLNVQLKWTVSIVTTFDKKKKKKKKGAPKWIQTRIRVCPYLTVIADR